MIKLNYKPVSVNQVWQGRRFKTDIYHKYERDLLLILPALKPPPPPYIVIIEFGMSKLSDIDNPIKPFLDILQKKYKINDRDIDELNVKKTIVKKGEEFIGFKINQTTQNKNQ